LFVFQNLNILNNQIEILYGVQPKQNKRIKKNQKESAYNLDEERTGVMIYFPNYSMETYMSEKTPGVMVGICFNTSFPTASTSTSRGELSNDESPPCVWFWWGGVGGWKEYRRPATAAFFGVAAWLLPISLAKVNGFSRAKVAREDNTEEEEEVEAEPINV
jgi:hypothetical protein